jgi:hypothetical protein
MGELDGLRKSNNSLNLNRSSAGNSLVGGDDATDLTPVKKSVLPSISEQSALGEKHLEQNNDRAARARYGLFILLVVLLVSLKALTSIEIAVFVNRAILANARASRK